MDFCEEVLLILQKEIELLFNEKDVSFSHRDNPYDTMVDFFSWLYRTIPVVRRRVTISNELKYKMEKEPATSWREHVFLFKDKFENGDNMNGFLSKQLYDAQSNDYLRNVWDIYHLHLSFNVANNKLEMKKNRSGWQLLAVITQTEALFVNVIQHPVHGENHLYFDKESLRIIRDNGWLERAGIVEMPMCFENQDDVNELTSKEIYSLNKSHINYAIELDGKRYMTPSILLNGQSLNTTDMCNRLVKNIQVLSHCASKCNDVIICLGDDNMLLVIADVDNIDGSRAFYNLIDGNKYVARTDY